MKPKRLAGVAFVGMVGASWIAAGAGPSAPLIGTKAPNFSAKGSDGKTHTLASVTKSGPVVLYFIQSTCPVNAEAMKYFNRVGAAYKGARLVGVIDENAAGYKEWAKEFKPTFPVLFDPNKTIIRAYQAQASPWAIHVKNGEIAKVWDGYSAKYLTELNASVASAAKSAPKKLDFKGAPTLPAFG